jgi:hypothetical protein
MDKEESGKDGRFDSSAWLLTCALPGQTENLHFTPRNSRLFAFRPQVNNPEQFFLGDGQFKRLFRDRLLRLKDIDFHSSRLLAIVLPFSTQWLDISEESFENNRRSCHRPFGNKLRRNADGQAESATAVRD